VQNTGLLASEALDSQPRAASYACMRIDHLVWFNADLAAGRRFFADRMDADPLYGGEHPGEGTANAVLSLGPMTYLEILGHDVKQAGAGLDPEVASLTGQGLYHWAVGGVDVAAAARRAAAAGLQGGALVPGGRVKPDGKRLDWLCWGLRDHGFGALVPFLIDWRDSEHPAASAPRGGSLTDLRVHTPEADRLRAIFAVLELEVPVVADPVARIEAVLESGKGRTVLTSFTPLPRGYVI
jgi:hypothetical protein